MIFITGCARSGTSLTTQILQRLGCNLGKVNSLYENTTIRETILKPYLRSIGADPLGQRKLPPTESVFTIPFLRDKVLAAIPGKEPRAYKDAKITLVWPAFHAAFPQAIWIAVRREPDAIVESCLRTSFMSSYVERSQWRSWVAEYEKRICRMRMVLPSFYEVWPDEFIADPDSPTLRHIGDKCGLQWNPDAVRQAVDRKAWHVSPLARAL